MAASLAMRRSTSSPAPSSRLRQWSWMLKRRRLFGGTWAEWREFAYSIRYCIFDGNHGTWGDLMLLLKPSERKPNGFRNNDGQIGEFFTGEVRFVIRAGCVLCGSDHGNVMPICSVVMLCYIRADRLAECYLVLLAIKAIIGPVRKQTVSLGRLAYLSFWACLRIVSDLSRGCANIWRVFWRESRYGQDRYKTVSILGPVQTHISRIDRLEIGTNARPCWPNATMLFLCYYYYFFFLISGRLYFSHLFGIFARAHNAATVQIAGDNSDSDNESCLES